MISQKPLAASLHRRLRRSDVSAVIHDNNVPPIPRRLADSQTRFSIEIVSRRSRLRSEHRAFRPSLAIMYQHPAGVIVTDELPLLFLSDDVVNYA